MYIILVQKTAQTAYGQPVSRTREQFKCCNGLHHPSPPPSSLLPRLLPGHDVPGSNLSVFCHAFNYCSFQSLDHI